MWRPRPDLRPRYDVVIVGGGVHGLAIAYELARRGVTDVAVIERSYIGSGGSGRNTAIIRSNYRTEAGVRFYDESVKRYERLSVELGFNVLFSQEGHLTLAHTESAITGLRVRADTNQLNGVDSRIVWPDEIRRLVPMLDLSSKPRFPILAGLYHPPGGIIRHDAVVWAYARAADRLGVEIHPFTEVTGVAVAGGRVQGVTTSRGPVAAGTVVNATAGWASTIAAMAGVRLPIVTHPLQAFVTEPLKPFLDKVIVSATYHVYITQTDRGELVIGQEIDPYSSYSLRSTLPFLETGAAHAVELLPCIAGVKVLRQWAGICDMTPDFAPIMSTTEVEGFVVDVGWGTYGFKAAPAAGYRVAELVATGRSPDVIAPFSLDRFANDRLLGEKAAAAVSH
ncbi:MAG: FAD-dependent oxidoreductase [Chloroflexi bacterium]|nr:FAD-dependent oxidoreductase [Chloroflexota bacterium]